MRECPRARPARPGAPTLCTTAVSRLSYGGDVRGAPAVGHAVGQRRAMPEAAVQSVLGDDQILGQHLDPHSFVAGSRDFRQTGPDPGFVPTGLALAVGHFPRPTDS